MGRNKESPCATERRGIKERGKGIGPGHGHWQAQTDGSRADSTAGEQEWALCEDEQLQSCITSTHLPTAGTEQPGNGSQSAASLISSFMDSNKSPSR